ncbi:hypothetical protein [Heyndrickxia acidiproducens]|uniref:hypothetical protein n=1 Tax=Heyndrickxia acidiproducens TaxID=1121084 RepID=UPI000371F0E7|nr:hypothetical protein [Heyndrickxia acidiproducens]
MKLFLLISVVSIYLYLLTVFVDFMMCRKLLASFLHPFAALNQFDTFDRILLGLLIALLILKVSIPYIKRKLSIGQNSN